MSHLRLVPPYVDPPAPPPWERVLDWLVVVCGSEEEVTDLDAAPLVGDEADEPPERLGATATLLDDLAERWFDDEVAVAMRRALRWLWEDDHAPATLGLHPEALAGGICWAVGKANGCFRPVGPLGVTRVGETVGVRGSLSVHGQRVRAALLGTVPARLPVDPRPHGVPDLVPLGDAGLLVSSTRAVLVRLRDSALREEAEADFYRGR